MALPPEEIKKVAHLSRLNVADDQLGKLEQDISNILGLVDQLQAANTDGIEPMAHPMDATQVLRADQVTEEDQRAHYQQCAPATEDGLYLVPKVIE